MTPGRIVPAGVSVRVSGVLLALCSIAHCAYAKEASPAFIDSQSQIKALWDQTLTSGDRVKIMASYDVVNDLHDGVGPMSAEECRAQSTALDDAMHVNPVGLGVWYVAYLCAEQLGDTNSAKERLNRFTSLVKYAVDALPPDYGATPIRVVSPIDIQIFITASGQQVLHKEYSLLQSERHLPMRVVLWDSQANHERWLAFDYLDTFVQLHREQPGFQAPSLRRTLALSILKRFSDTDPAAKAALELREAMQIPDKQARIAKLTELASSKNFSAAISLATACSVNRELHCENQAIDALLPYVEEKDASATLALASFYAEGLGVTRNDNATRKLLAAADERLGSRLGTLLFAIRRFDRGQAALPELVRGDVEKLAQRGDAFAELMNAATALAQRKSTDKPKDLPSWIMSQLRDSADKRLPAAQGALGFLLAAQDKSDEALSQMQQAAKGHFEAAEAYLASLYERGWPEKKFPRDLERASYWYAQAGADGDVASMLWLGRHYRDQPDNESNRLAARAWFQSADMHGSTEGALGLAAMYRDRRGDEDGTPASAVAIYRALSENRNSAEARRAWAAMLRGGNGVETNLGEARRLLMSDAENGDAQSQYELGVLLLADTEIKNVEDGLKWMRKSAEQGNAVAIYWMAWEYETGRHLSADASKAITNYRLATDKGNVDAMASLAVMAIEGRGMAADRKFGIKLLNDAAVRGNSEAMWRLGDDYAFGAAEIRDRVQAMAWYRKSAERSNPAGMRGLGNLLVGDTDSQQQAEGLEWLSRAAAAGNIVAPNDLGLAYMNGTGVKRDYVAAVKWFQQGDAAGNSQSTFNLAWMKLKGQGGPVDLTGARLLLEKASKVGNTVATLNFANMLLEGSGGEKDTKRAWQLLDQCAAAGNTNCVMTLGLGYRYGHVGGKDDLGKAKEYLTRLENNDDARAQLAEINYRENSNDDAKVREAVGKIRQLAEKGSPRAQLLLAEACAYGYPMPRDGACARAYFEKVADDFSAAASNLGLLYEVGTGGSVDYAAAEKWFRKAIAMGLTASHYELGRLLLHTGRVADAQRELLAVADDARLAAYVLQRYCKSHHDCAPNPKLEKLLKPRVEDLSSSEKNNLAWGLSSDVMSDLEDGNYAVKLMLSVPADARSNYAFLDTLAAAYARAGDFDSAVTTEQESIAKVPGDSTHLRATMEERLRLYGERKTWNLPY